MIHAKLLIRRLAYVPWLLAFGLVLGWAGEAQAANEIRLKVNNTEIREDGGGVDITVTAETFVGTENKALGSEQVVNLSVASEMTLRAPGAGETEDQTDINTTLDGMQVDAYGKRFYMTLVPIVIGKDAKKADATVKITPIPTNHENDPSVTAEYSFTKRITNEDLTIVLYGTAGATSVKESTAATGLKITMLDTDKPTTEIRLALDPSSRSKEAQPFETTVSASVNGAKLSKNVSFSLTSVDVAKATSTPEAQRDRDYDIDPSSLSIRKTEISGKTKITITPKNGEAGFFGVGTKQTITVSGVDANVDGDTRDSWQAYGATETDVGTSITFNEVGFLRDLDGDDPPNANETLTDFIGPKSYDHDNDTNTGAIYRYFENDRNGDGTVDDPFDLNGDGDTSDTLKVVEEKNLLYSPVITAADFELKATAAAAADGTGLTASVTSVRESLPGQTDSRRTVEITLDLKLKTGPPTATTLGLLIRDEGGDKQATRGQDYEATVTSIALDKGQKTGSATLTLTIIDNDKTDNDRTFTVKGSIGAASVSTIITIVDDEKPTKAISLKVEPSTVKGLSGQQTVTVTAHLDGETFDDDVNITLVIDPAAGDKKATRDVHFEATLPMDPLTIEAGQTMGSTTISVTALKEKGEDKTITLKSQTDPLATPLNSDGDKIDVGTVAITLKDAAPADAAAAAGPTALAFDGDVGDLATNVGKEVSKELPGAKEGSGEGSKTYTASPLPEGLTFNAATRMLEGSPTKEETVTVVYTLVDSVDASVVQRFDITVGAKEKETVAVSEVTVSAPSLREGTTETIRVTAVLEKDAPEGEEVTFNIVNGTAERDIHFSAALGDIEGSKKEFSVNIEITARDDDNTGHKKFTVVAEASGGSAMKDIEIRDDDSASSEILLSVDPKEIQENAGSTDVTVTATLDGKEEDAVVTLKIRIDGGTAERDGVDYTASNLPTITIAAGDIEGTGSLSITPNFDDDNTENAESITLTGTITSKSGLSVSTVDISLLNVDPATTPDPDPLAFAEDASIDSIMGTVGMKLEAVKLPAAMGGAEAITYDTSDLPDGLKFDAETRELSGTPTMADSAATEVSYVATSGAETDTLTFSIMVSHPPLEFAKGAEIPDIEVTVNEALKAQVLPAAMGGAEAITYSVKDLPAGLDFKRENAGAFGNADGRRRNQGHLHGGVWRRRSLVDLLHQGQPTVGI